MKIFVKQLNPMGSMSLRPLLILFSIYQTNEFSIYTFWSVWCTDTYACNVQLYWKDEVVSKQQFIKRILYNHNKWFFFYAYYSHIKRNLTTWTNKVRGYFFMSLISTLTNNNYRYIHRILKCCGRSRLDSSS